MNPIFTISLFLGGTLLGWFTGSIGEAFIQRFRPEHAHKSVAWTHTPAFRIAIALTVGIFTTLPTLRYTVPIHQLGYSLMAWLFIFLAVIDIKYRIIPNPLIAAGLALALVLHLLTQQIQVSHIVVGAVFAFAIFFAVAILRPGGLGMGDVKLSTLIGVIFGFPNVLWALIISAGVSAVVLVTLMLHKHHRLTDTIPYAPFLCIGALVMLVITTTITA